MSEQNDTTEQRSERFSTLPPTVPAEDLRAGHDPEPAHEELDDGYREQTWQVNSIS